MGGVHGLSHVAEPNTGLQNQLLPFYLLAESNIIRLVWDAHSNSVPG